MNDIKRTTLKDRVQSAITAFRGKPEFKMYYGLEVKQCKNCEYRHLRNALQVVYRDLVDYHHNGADIDFDRVLDYIGLVLGERKRGET